MDFLNDLIDELCDDLTEELREDEEGGSFNASLLESKVKSAVREVMSIRRYPSDYTDEMIEKDVRKYYSAIRKLSLYDYNSIGMEFEYMHTEKNITRSFSSRNSILYGVLPIVRSF